jgi:hypothetical protein
MAVKHQPFQRFFSREQRKTVETVEGSLAFSSPAEAGF